MTPGFTFCPNYTLKYTIFSSLCIASPPSDTYGYGASDEVAIPDLTPIIVLMLALVGLSLLFPTFTQVETNGRKRRDVNEYRKYIFTPKMLSTFKSVNST